MVQYQSCDTANCDGIEGCLQSADSEDKQEGTASLLLTSDGVFWNRSCWWDEDPTVNWASNTHLKQWVYVESNAKAFKVIIYAPNYENRYEYTFTINASTTWEEKNVAFASMTPAGSPSMATVGRLVYLYVAEEAELDFKLDDIRLEAAAASSLLMGGSVAATLRALHII